MNLNEINLPDVLLAELYKDNLVLIDNELAAQPKNPKKEKEKAAVEIISESEDAKNNIVEANENPIAFLGNNHKQISIIVNDKTAIHLQDEWLDILSNILSACKLNLADVAIINNHTQNINDAKLRQELTPKFVFLFGVETSAINLPFSISLYKPYLFNNCHYMQAVSLEMMKGTSTQAKLEKSKLWVSLKSLFGI